MINFSLNTFIKLCLLDTGDKISELQKHLGPHQGFGFYLPLKQSVRAFCDGDKEKAVKIISNPANEIQRERNKDAFDVFCKKFGKSNSLEKVKQDEVLKFSSAGISITINPLFEISKSENRQVYSLWPNKKPVLTQRYGAVACHLMRRAYGNSNLANCSFFFTDTVAGKTYSEKQITSNTSVILNSDVESIGRLLKNL